MSLAALTTFSTPVSATTSEQRAFSGFPQSMTIQDGPLENPLAGAELNACINGPDSFERGAIDAGTFNDGVRALSSIGGYYFQRNTGSIEQRLARADQYSASLENCSADDLRVAALLLDTWFPEVQTGDDPMAPLAISARSFATAEIRGRLEQAVLRERRSGV
jgi:hypothetical protein